MKIDPASGIPIYLQIMQEIKLAAASGRLRPGDRLPSVRELALELRINPNTVAKACALLRDEGIIDSRAGDGNYLSGALAECRRAGEEMIRGELRKLLAAADGAGVSRARLRQLLEESLNQQEEME